MLTRIFTIGFALTLAFAVLAACNDDDVNDVEDVDPVEELDDDEQTVDPDSLTSVDDDDATNDEDDDGVLGQAAGEADDEDIDVVEETTDVTLVDHEIEMIDTVPSGIVVFAITNEGEMLHGIAIEAASDDDENGGELLGVMTVSSGETEQLELQLDPGEYTIFCPVGEHREDESMETQLVVE